jgi:hypothetical protein
LADAASPFPGRWRLTIVTLLDAVLIVSASAAVLIGFGMRVRTVASGVLISIRSPWNAILIAGACAALRVMSAGRVRLLPAIPVPDRASFDAERLRFVMRAPASREARIYALIALAGSVVWIVPHLLHPRWVPDIGDPLFSAWRIARITHQLVTDPGHLFDGNTFYPLPLSLMFSDPTFLEALVGAPFLLAGADPLMVANLLTILAIPACGLAFFYAAWRMTGDPRASLVSALIGAWYPFHAEHYSHLELQWLMFVPLAIVAALRMLAAPGVKRGAVFGAAIAAQWLASMYIGVMLLSFLVPFLAIVQIGWRVRPAALVRAGVGALAVAAPAFLLLGIPYMKGRTIHGDRGQGEVMAGSASPADYGHPHRRLASYQWIPRSNNRPERELMPGISTITLAAIGALPPAGVAGIATVVSGAAMFELSMGLKGLIYPELYGHAAAFRGMRVPARFSAVVGCALALLGAVGAKRLLRLARTPRKQAILALAMAAIVILDLRMSPDIGPRAVSIPRVYDLLRPQMVLAQLPRNHDTEYMYFSTRTWPRMLGGYSGFMPETPGLAGAIDAFPEQEAVQALKHLGATHLMYNCAIEVSPVRCQTVLDALEASNLVTPIASERWFVGEVRLYRFRE